MNLAFLGLLAGAEIAVCFGIRVPLRDVEPGEQLAVRKGIIYRLRIIVPALFFPGLGMTIYRLTQDRSPFRIATLVSLMIWMALTFGGTVPINQAVLTWKADALPSNWREVMTRWERLDIARATAAVTALIFAVVAS